MNWDVLTQMLTALGALGGVAGLGAVAKIGVERRQGRAAAQRVEVDAGKVVTDTAVGLLEPLRTQIGFLAEELARSRAEAERDRAESALLRREVHDLREYIGELVASLRGLQAPVPTPPRGLAGVTDLRKRDGL